jgi:hypothetical protein
MKKINFTKKRMIESTTRAGAKWIRKFKIRKRMMIKKIQLKKRIFKQGKANSIMKMRRMTSLNQAKIISIRILDRLEFLPKIDNKKLNDNLKQVR